MDPIVTTRFWERTHSASSGLIFGDAEYKRGIQSRTGAVPVFQSVSEQRRLPPWTAASPDDVRFAFERNGLAPAAAIAVGNGFRCTRQTRQVSFRRLAENWPARSGQRRARSGDLT